MTKPPATTWGKIPEVYPQPLTIAMLKKGIELLPDTMLVSTWQEDGTALIIQRTEVRAIDKNGTIMSHDQATNELRVLVIG